MATSPALTPGIDSSMAMAPLLAVGPAAAPLNPSTSPLGRRGGHKVLGAAQAGGESNPGSRFAYAPRVSAHLH